MIANPVAPIGNDPWVTQKDGMYYYCYSWHRTLWVKRDKQLDKVLQFPGKKVWVPLPGLADTDWQRSDAAVLLEKASDAGLFRNVIGD